MNLLQNKTVCLRAPEPEDLELLYSWENNPEWWEIGNTLAPYSRYLLKEYIAESHRGIFDLKQLRLMIDLCSTGATVGMLDLYDFRIIAGRESAYWSIRFTRRTDWRQKRWSYWLNMLFLI